MDKEAKTSFMVRACAAREDTRNEKHKRERGERGGGNKDELVDEMKLKIILHMVVYGRQCWKI